MHNFTITGNAGGALNNQDEAATRLESYTPSAQGFPLGEWRASDHPRATRSGVVMARGEGHRLVIGSPGSGKFTSVIAPLLLTCDKASVFVFDVANGEATKVTAAHRARLGEIIIIDPFALVVPKSGAINPLDLLKEDSPHLLVTAKRLTDALFIVGQASNEDSYWNDQAREVLTALLIHVATSPAEAGQRTLKRVREIIRRPYTPELLGAMMANKAAGGVVSDLALSIDYAEKVGSDKNTFAVQNTLKANTLFLDLPEIQKVTSHTTLKPSELRTRVSSLYVVVPEYELRTVGRWLRLLYSVVMEEMRTAAKPGVVPLHVVLDEFPAMGAYSRVADDMALVRKYGIHMHIIVQSLTQLKDLYGNGWEKFTASAKFQQVLGLNDQFSAEYISKRIGNTTTASTSSSENQSQGGGSSGKSKSWIGTPLMSPEEIGRIPKDFFLCLVENEFPKKLRKWHYFNSDFFKQRATKIPR